MYESRIRVLLERLRVHYGETVRVLITADHGQTAVREEDAIDLHPLDSTPGLCSVPSTGDTRIAFFYPRTGKFDTVRKWFAPYLDRVDLYTYEEFLAT